MVRICVTPNPKGLSTGWSASLLQIWKFSDSTSTHSQWVSHSVPGFTHTTHTTHKHMYTRSVLPHSCLCRPPTPHSVFTGKSYKQQGPTEYTGRKCWHEDVRALTRYWGKNEQVEATVQQDLTGTTGELSRNISTSLSGQLLQDNRDSVSFWAAPPEIQSS